MENQTEHCDRHASARSQFKANTSIAPIFLHENDLTTNFSRL
ncbi:MAG: hypothetical protein AAGA60_15240 [Cyanobacteria bacterium P01_E01_bin.42]